MESKTLIRQSAPWAPSKSPQEKVRVELTMVTPEMAEYFLTTDTQNRSVRPLLVAKYIREMESGWDINGSTIVFDEDDHLIDGQHRLLAIIKVGKPQKMLIVYGVKRDMRTTIDTGAKRTASDNLEMAGYPNKNALAGTCRLLMDLKVGTTKHAAYSNREIIDFLNKHPEINKDVSDNQVTRVKVIIPPRIAGAFRHLTRWHSPHATMSDRAFNVLEHGIPEYQGDAMHAFRERMINGVDREWLRTKEGSFPMMYTLVSAWNSFVKREVIHTVRTKTKRVEMLGVDYGNI